MGVKFQMDESNIILRQRILFKIPENLTTIALPASTSTLSSFVMFSKEVPLDRDKVARYLIPKQAGNDEVVLPIVTIGGIILENQTEKQVGTLIVKRGEYPEGYVT